MLKKAESDSLATALANIVFPLPGGPKRRSPLVGVRNPVKSSGLRAGNITVSCKACLAECWPATSLKQQMDPASIISFITTLINLLLSIFLLEDIEGVEFVRTLWFLGRVSLPDMHRLWAFLAGCGVYGPLSRRLVGFCGLITSV